MMRLSRMVLSCVWIVATVAGCASPGGDGGALTGIDIGPGVEVEVGTDGGVVTTSHEGVTYTITFPAGALEAPVTIGMTPARFEGVEGSLAVRLEPDGLVLRFPVPLTISQRPAGSILLAAVAGDAPIEAVLAMPATDLVVMPVSHFSTHGVVTSNSVYQRLKSDLRALMDDVDSEELVDDPKLAALALGELYRSMLAPLIAAAPQGHDAFLRAAAPLAAWGSLAQQLAAHGEPHQLRGTQSVEDLWNKSAADLVALGYAQLAERIRPACTAVMDTVLDWVEVPNSISAMLQLLGETEIPTIDLCVDARLVVTGPTTLLPTDDKVLLDVRHELVAPQGDPLPYRADVSFALTGVTGPTQLDLVTGELLGIVFSRPTASRPTVVSVTVAAFSQIYQRGVAPAEAARYEVVETGTGATIMVTPATLGPNDATAQVCVSAVVASTPASDFTVDFSVDGGGVLEAETVSMSGPMQCTTYARPSPTPAAGADVTLHAAVRNLPNGVTLQADKSLSVAAGQPTVALTVPDLVEKNGVATVCLDLVENTVPGNLPWTANFRAVFDDGESPVTDEGTFTVSVLPSTDGGQVCTVWMAPNRYVDVTMIGTATTSDGRTFVTTKLVDVNDMTPPTPSRGVSFRETSASSVGVTRFRDDSHVTPAPITQSIVWNESQSSLFVRGSPTQGTYVPMDVNFTNSSAYNIFNLSGSIDGSGSVKEQIVVGIDSSVTTGSIEVKADCGISWNGTGLPNCNQVLASDVTPCAQATGQGLTQYRITFHLLVPTAIVLTGSYAATGNASIVVGTEAATRVRIFGEPGTSLDVSANSRTNAGTFSVDQRITLSPGEWSLEVNASATCFNADSSLASQSYNDDAAATLTWTLENP